METEQHTGVLTIISQFLLLRLLSFSYYDKKTDLCIICSVDLNPIICTNMVQVSIWQMYNFLHQ